MTWRAGQSNTEFLHWKCLSKQSVTATQCGFQQQFQRSDAPSCNTLPLWVSKWCQEGLVMDHWRTVNHKDIHFWLIQCRAGKGHHVSMQVCAGQLGSKLSHSTQRNALFTEFSIRTCITIHTTSKWLRNLVNRRRWADFSFAKNSCIWWKTTAT
jgi:hypothetical protein